ncbi:arylsulfatase [Haladaptatus sp. W1]|uniref:sulfatase-like hydrolase/transferase n=1 Tax=Haladaptatus sp. W1 TaxID=1897478 RepID=UPI0008499CC1|nr:sulfatase-like hydrolase/transferase [Haladaptatus sp. W1]ODR82474.1 arylsulfatase [Haladaptatus sp. W1]
MTNIALIVLDTLRKDYFDKHFDWLPGRRFENAWSTSHWTAPAHASLFTGKYPSEVGIYTNSQRFDCKEPLLAERFADAGYITRGISANPNISPAFDANRGFQKFDSQFQIEGIGEGMFDWEAFIAESKDMGPERFAIALKRCVFGDYETIPSLKHGAKLKLRDMGFGNLVTGGGSECVLSFVRETDFGDREFFFANLMEAHAPYDPPEPFKTVDVDVDTISATVESPDACPSDIRQAYDDSIRYLSRVYEQIFEELQADFDIIVTVSDHGELLGEHDSWGHMFGLYPELTNVPLSVYTADGAHGESDVAVNLFDVHRTLVDVIDIESNGRGQNLLRELDNSEFLTEYHGLRKANYLGLRNEGLVDADRLNEQLIGVVSGDYYGYETFDGWSERGSAPCENPKQRINELVSECDHRHVKDEEYDLDDDIVSRLKDLGYA